MRWCSSTQRARTAHCAQLHCCRQFEWDDVSSTRTLTRRDFARKMPGATKHISVSDCTAARWSEDVSAVANTNCVSYCTCNLAHGDEHEMPYFSAGCHTVLERCAVHAVFQIATHASSGSESWVQNLSAAADADDANKRNLIVSGAPHVTRLCTSQLTPQASQVQSSTLRRT